MRYVVLGDFYVQKLGSMYLITSPVFTTPSEPRQKIVM
jgi:hypothetical protein